MTDNLSISTDSLEQLLIFKSVMSEIQEAINSRNPDLLIAIIHKLAERIAILQSISKNTLLKKEVDFKVEFPEKPMDVFHETLLNHFKSFPAQSQVLWNGYTCAQMVKEFEGNTPVAGEYTAYLLDQILSSQIPDKAEVWDSEKHSIMTDLVLAEKASTSSYMLMKTLKHQFDRVAMKGYLEQGDAQAYLSDVEDLKRLAQAFLESL